jgi:hypothetical protein
MRDILYYGLAYLAFQVWVVVCLGTHLSFARVLKICDWTLDSDSEGIKGILLLLFISIRFKFELGGACHDFCQCEGVWGVEVHFGHVALDSCLEGGLLVLVV